MSIVWEIENMETSEHRYVSADNHEEMRAILFKKGFVSIWNCSDRMLAKDDCLSGHNAAGHEISAMPATFGSVNCMLPIKEAFMDQPNSALKAEIEMLKEKCEIRDQAIAALKDRKTIDF